MSPISAAYIRECFDVRSGVVHWRWRPDHHFATPLTAQQINQRFAGQPVKFRLSDQGYRKTTIGGKTVLEHRIVWALTYGCLPGEIDHINGDRTDNRLENLRVVSRAQQMQNVRRNTRNTSGVTGVYRHKQNGNWVASIQAYGRKYHIGCFSALDDAIAARLRKQHELGFSERHGRPA